MQVRLIDELPVDSVLRVSNRVMLDDRIRQIPLRVVHAPLQVDDSRPAGTIDGKDSLYVVHGNPAVGAQVIVVPVSVQRRDGSASACILGAADENISE